MEEKSDKKEENLKEIPAKKPNENAGFNFSSHIKIYDPNTKEVFLKKRGDE